MTPSQRRAVLAAAAALALLAVVGAGVLVARSGDDASLATAAPSTSATPSTPPSASPTPSAPPSAPPSPSAAPALALDDAFLSPEQAGAAESPGWSVDEAYEPSPGPVYDPCDEGTAPQAQALAASAERSMTSTREAGGSTLVQELYGYDDEVAAQDALIGYVRATEQCPTDDVPDTDADTVERTALRVTDDRYLVRERYCNPECTGLYSTFTLVARAGQAVTVAAYAQGEDGEPEDAARALLDAVAEQLAAAVEG